MLMRVPNTYMCSGNIYTQGAHASPPTPSFTRWWGVRLLECVAVICVRTECSVVARFWHFIWSLYKFIFSKLAGANVGIVSWLARLAILRAQCFLVCHFVLRLLTAVLFDMLRRRKAIAFSTWFPLPERISFWTPPHPTRTDNHFVCMNV